MSRCAISGENDADVMPHTRDERFGVWGICIKREEVREKCEILGRENHINTLHEKLARIVICMEIRYTNIKMIEMEDLEDMMQ